MTLGEIQLLQTEKGWTIGLVSVEPPPGKPYPLAVAFSFDRGVRLSLLADALEEVAASIRRELAKYP